MKILVISLLRLGDILLMLPAIKSLKNQNPNAEVHLLINKQFSFIKNIIPFVDKFHFFERDYFQASMADVDTPILNAFDILSEDLKKIDKENFRVVYNLTHTNISGHIIS
ncbi:MAG: hypothetical protein KDC90_19055, partial [Ignavibacteriae bacterium]|nr:hypothetical protein [Ignavibacteriota bacterium]